MVEIIGFALALVGFLLALGVWYRSDKITKDLETKRKDLEQRLSRAETRNKQVEAKAAALTDRASELEKELAEAIARRDEKAMASAMWQLELERSYRQWHDVIVPDPQLSRDNEATAGQQLTFAIGQEVERLREEVGVAISFDGEARSDIEPETALGALRITEELLAMAAKQADQVAVSVGESDDSEATLTIAVDCVGWDNDDAADTSELSQTVQMMAQRLDGGVQWERGDDHLVIDVSLPFQANVARH